MAVHFPILRFRVNIISLATLLILAACAGEKSTTMDQNELHNETSPYLLQHADNPVHWKPWGKEALQLAQDSNKLLIISIGYSSCHWCHVMEHESFEDSAVAELMNAHFVSIKVDREERPDVDEVYMTALQLMRNQGGWPLNIVALPDGRPIWGATYVPKENWKDALKQLAQVHKKEPEKVEEYAQKLSQGVRQAGLVPEAEDDSAVSAEDLDQMVAQWQRNFDREEGGPQKAPKFPLPNNYEFLMHYAHETEHEAVMEHVDLTLRKMAHGGIYDQVGGGFARYSTDTAWRVPHFEKMLYDNAQLLALYSQAYRRSGNALYKSTVEETITWLQREMKGEHGAYFSALDADSEGEEGKFYVWQREELQGIIPGDDWEEFSDYYDLKKGLWEEDKIILMRSGTEADPTKVENWKRLLLKHRAQRTRPGLDDKALTSWNALLISGYCEAYKSLGKEAYIAEARSIADWILNKQLQDKNALHHSFKNGQSSVTGLIEDYAFATQAFLDLFEITAEERYLHQAKAWQEYANQKFKDSLFYFTRSKDEQQLFAQNQEVTDNVIPASNSVMAHNLWRLYHYFGEDSWRQQSLRMLQSVREQMLQYPAGFSNWGQLAMKEAHPFYEVAISGPGCKARLREMQAHYLPQTLFIGSDKESELPLLQNRYNAERTRIFVCQNRACKLPVEKVDEALAQLKSE